MGIKTRAELGLTEVLNRIGGMAQAPEVRAAAEAIPWVKGHQTPIADEIGGKISRWYQRLSTGAIDWTDAREMFFAVQQLLQEHLVLKEKFDGVLAEQIGQNMDRQVANEFRNNFRRINQENLQVPNLRRG